MFNNPKKSFQYAPYRLNHTAVFGVSTSTKLPSGVSKPDIKAVATLHYASVKRTLTQTYSLVGTRLDNTKIIAVAHNKQLEDCDLVKIDNDLYNIVDASIDDDTSYLTYDLLTIQKVTKGGND